MSNRRLAWNVALRDLTDDRHKVPAGFVSAKAMAAFSARTRPLVAATGAYDRAAIMAAAVSAAKAHQRRTGSTWAAAMSVALSAAWATARAARARTAH